MAEQNVVVYKDEKHIPSDVGDTIPARVIPVSTEQGNTISIKDDGIFATGGSGGVESVAVNVEPITSTSDNNIRTSGNKVTVTVTEGGRPTAASFLVARPRDIVAECEGSTDYGLSKNRIKESVLEADGSSTSGQYEKLPNAVLRTPTLDGTTLKLKLRHYIEGDAVDNSEQEVSIDLATIAGTKLVETQDAPNTTTGSDIPTQFYGPNRDKLLTEPDKWLEVTIGSERGVVPWFKLP